MSLPQTTQTTFRAVLDELIPARDASLPGAGTLGVGEYVEAHLGEAVDVVASGLAALESLANERSRLGFADLPADQRAPLLSEVASTHPGFVESLIFRTYSGYYQNKAVSAAIGVPPRPPHPLGYELESGDLGLLDAVRKRAKLYREV